MSIFSVIGPSRSRLVRPHQITISSIGPLLIDYSCFVEHYPHFRYRSCFPPSGTPLYAPPICASLPSRRGRLRPGLRRCLLRFRLADLDDCLQSYNHSWHRPGCHETRNHVSQGSNAFCRARVSRGLRWDIVFGRHGKPTRSDDILPKAQLKTKLLAFANELVLLAQFPRTLVHLAFPSDLLRVESVLPDPTFLLAPTDRGHQLRETAKRLLSNALSPFCY